MHPFETLNADIAAAHAAYRATCADANLAVAKAAQDAAVAAHDAAIACAYAKYGATP